MQLSGLHILLTYRCTLECDHCFVWGGPRQTGVLAMDDVSRILEQAREAGIKSIYFEGGEPFLYYVELVRGVHAAAEMGFEVGIVSNAYWAVSIADAEEWLQPFVGRITDLSIAAAKWLNIPTGMISISQPDQAALSVRGQLTAEAEVMYRGRAAEVLAPQHMTQQWDSLDSCPHEDLREPGRLHVDPQGNLHVCQGVIIGNLFEKPLKEICAGYDPGGHPICSMLLDGGPAALISEFGLEHRPAYADACHMCYDARLALRERFPALLGPDQMYGVIK
jgi:hypothetical protein